MKGMKSIGGTKYGAAVKGKVGALVQKVVNKTGAKHMQRVEKGHASKGNLVKTGSGKNLGSRSVKAQGLK